LAYTDTYILFIDNPEPPMPSKVGSKSLPSIEPAAVDI
jgi:hypothetical protein